MFYSAKPNQPFPQFPFSTSFVLIIAATSATIALVLFVDIQNVNKRKPKYSPHPSSCSIQSKNVDS